MDKTREFTWRHEQLMHDDDAALLCCYHDPETGVYCEATATHGVVCDGTLQVQPWRNLPLLRDKDWNHVTDPPRWRRHPEFCQAHAEEVCAERIAGRKALTAQGVV